MVIHTRHAVHYYRGWNEVTAINNVDMSLN